MLSTNVLDAAFLLCDQSNHCDLRAYDLFNNPLGNDASSFEQCIVCLKDNKEAVHCCSVCLVPWHQSCCRQLLKHMYLMVEEIHVKFGLPKALNGTHCFLCQHWLSGKAAAAAAEADGAEA